MSSLVNASIVERIVGRERHPILHWARLNPDDQTVTILHSQACIETSTDLRECRFSLAMDRGVDARYVRLTGQPLIAHVDEEGLLAGLPGPVHVLEVEKDDDGYWGYASMQCITPSGCDGWTECTEEHPFPDDEAREMAEDDGHHAFHGVEHQYRYGYGWTVPYDGCVLAGSSEWSDGVSEAASHIGEQYGEGRHAVADDWSDNLPYVERIDAL